MGAGSATRNRAADIKRACIVERIDIFVPLQMTGRKYVYSLIVYFLIALLPSVGQTYSRNINLIAIYGFSIQL